jgi:hypothetical protein
MPHKWDYHKANSNSKTRFLKKINGKYKKINEK